ncbi:MAG: hypothetical protein K0Q79_501 [Flavipsychrobacter sp.]|jgi:hypothetical protein|nr:hypothetical protein [Flavipsychrobacter sp.]
MFTRTRQYQFSIPKELLRYRLVGNHITIHRRDFTVLENEQSISITPTIENESGRTTLPITQVELKDDGNKTEMVITSTMHTIEAGAQMLIMLFCVFFLAASLILLYVGQDIMITVSLCSISFLVFIFFLIRLQLGYFDYVRKIRSYVKHTGDEITTDVRKQLFKHKA